MNQDDELKGTTSSVEVRDSAGHTRTLTNTQYFNAVTDATDYARINPSAPSGVHLALAKKVTATLNGSATGITTAVDLNYDQYGNVIDRYNEAVVNESGDERRTCISYVAPGSTYVAQFPSRIFQTAGVSCSTATGTQILSQTLFDYDVQGSDIDGFWTTRRDHLRNGSLEKDVVTTRTPDAYGNVKTVVDPNGNPPTQIAYDGDGGSCGDTGTHTVPCVVTNPLGQTEAFSFDGGLGLLTQRVDVNQNATLFSYDPLGRMNTVKVQAHDQSSPTLLRQIVYPIIAGSGTTGATGNWGVVSQDPTSRTPDPNAQNIQTIDFASASSTLPETTLQSQMFFDGLGRVIRTRDDGDKKKLVDSIMTYDTRGRLFRKYLPYFSETDTSPGFSQFSYDELGRVVAVKNPNNSCTVVSHEIGLTATQHTGVKTILQQQDACTSPTSVPARAAMLRDAYGNVVEVQEFQPSDTSTPYKTTYKYDVLNNLVEVDDACAQAAPAPGCHTGQRHTTNITYDTLSRKVAMSDPAMGSWTYAYDDAGNISSQTDNSHNTISFRYDPLNRLKQKTYSGGTQAPITFTYDQGTNATGRLTTVSDSAGIVKYSYDARGNITQFIRDFQPLNREFKYTYSYDNLDRLTGIDYPIQAYSEVQGGSVGGPVATVSYTYTDVGGNQTPFVQTITGPVSWTAEPGPLVQQGTEYDAFGNLTQWTDGSGVQTKITTDDRTGQMKENEVSPGGNSSDIFHQIYTYDPTTYNITHVQNEGNEITDQDYGRDSSSAGYDALGRLIGAVGPWQPNSLGVLANYSYDPLGNILTKDDIASYQLVKKTLSYTHPTSPHAVMQLTVGDGTVRDYTYDPNGNMGTRVTTGTGTASTRVFSWDQDNRLVQVTEDDTVVRKFVYDYTGERVVDSTGQWPVVYMPTRDFVWMPSSGLYGNANIYVFLGSVRVACVGIAHAPPNVPTGGWVYWEELGKAAGNAAVGLWPFLLMLMGLGIVRWWTDPRRAPVPVLVRRAGIGSLVIAFLVTSSSPAKAILPPPYLGSLNLTLYYHADYKGSVSVITSDTQEPVQGIDYWPFGAVRGMLTNPNYWMDARNKFTDQELDNDLGLYYYGGRWYDAEIGRFLSSDPVIPDPLNPQSLNRYAYVLNNPTNLTDPSGYYPCDSGLCIESIGGGGFPGGGLYFDIGGVNISITFSIGSVGYFGNFPIMSSPGLSYIPVASVPVVPVTPPPPRVAPGSAFGGGGGSSFLAQTGTNHSYTGAGLLTAFTTFDIFDPEPLSKVTVFAGLGLIATYITLSNQQARAQLGQLFNSMNVEGESETASEEGESAQGAPAREADLVPNKRLDPGHGLSKEDAVEEVRHGGNVLAKDQRTARDIANKVGGGEPIHEKPGPRAGPSGRPHYHPATPHGQRLPGHVFY